jgi:hypothetical protein
MYGIDMYCPVENCKSKKEKGGEALAMLLEKFVLPVCRSCLHDWKECKHEAFARLRRGECRFFAPLNPRVESTKVDDVGSHLSRPIKD